MQCEFDGNNLCGYVLESMSDKLQWKHEMGYYTGKKLHQPKVDANKNSTEGNQLNRTVINYIFKVVKIRFKLIVKCLG